jgi:hypothetical protein
MRRAFAGLALPAAVLVASLAALLPTSCGGGALPVDGARALARVKAQVDMGPRVAGTPGDAKLRDWIVAEAAKLGGRIERQAFVDSSLGHPLALENIIVRYGPTTGRRVMFCAHFDSRPWCDQDPDSTWHDKPMPAANDGGSGVAVLFELAELMHRKAPPVGVDLVFFDGEDLGTDKKPDDFCLGSKGYAKRLPPQGDPARPVAGFLLDMIGDADLDIWTERNSAERASNLAVLVSEAARASGAVHFHSQVRWNIIDDHIPLLDAGLPTVDLIDFDYPAWHTHRDLSDQVSAASLAEVARVCGWIVYRSDLVGGQ